MGRLPWRLAALLALGACGERAPRDPVAEMVAEAIPRIERVTGLAFKQPPAYRMQGRDSVRAFLERRFNEDTPEAELRGNERAYKRLGLLPDTLDLRRFMLALLTEQVAGYYDPARKVLFVVSGADQEMQRITVTHELVHALQDQYIALDSLQAVQGRNDRQMAGQAVMEGQATFEQMSVMLGGGTMVANLPGGWERVRTLIRENSASMPLFSSAPMLIQETLLFPYLSGAEFIRAFKEKRPGEAPYGDMPASTEQVLHDDRFFVTRDAPTELTLPPLPGRVVYTNTLGEFETRLLLFERSKDRDAAYRGAAGWDGDRYVLFESGGGEGLAWVTVWDTAVDAAEFFDLLDGTLRKRSGLPRGQGEQVTRTHQVGGRTIQLRAAEVAGRPVVLMVDVPAGTRPDVLDLGRVTLAP